MFKYLIVALLLTATIQQDATLFLTPTYPSSAFIQQYYEVIFRVRGLDGPTFTFANLPNFFTGSADGTLSGTPNITGTFKINISYTDGTNSGSSRVVINVLGSPNTAASAKQNSEVVFLVIQNAISSWIFRSGDFITLQLSANGTAPITWNYNSLPSGLNGDNSGKISGKINEAGLYSFSASAGDSRGLKAESYYTLNIQPGTFIKSNHLSYIANNILDVPNRNVPVVYDISQVESQQIAADNAVVKALGATAEAKSAAQVSQAAQAKAQLALNLATSQEGAAAVTFAKAQDIYNAAVNTQYIAQANLNTAKNIVAVATTALTNANAVLAAAKANLDAALAVFATATSAFNVASDAYTKAKNELTQAQADYNTAVANVKDAQNAYSLAWANVQTRKNELDEANNKLLQANAQVVNAKNAVGLATQANDDAQTNLNVADAALTAAQHTLQDANAAVADLSAQIAEAGTHLGSAKFNYIQALNALFVAQSAKAESDRALAIAYAQGAASTDIFKGQSTYVFNGCLNSAYPSISGTVSVTNLIPNGAQLSSGHVVTWGDCTTKQTINIGDVISYSGSIVGNCISASSVQVVKSE